MEPFYTSIKLSQVERQADYLAGLLEDGQQQTFVEQVRQRGDMIVELVEEDGASVVVAGFSPEWGLGHGEQEQLAQLYSRTAENGGELSQRYDAAEFADRLPLVDGVAPPDGAQKPGQDPGQELGRRDAQSVMHARLVETPAGQRMLLVRAGITPVSATVEALRAQLGIVSGIMLLLAVGIALLMAGHVARPVVRLNKEAHKLAKGDYSAAFEGGGYREVDELSQTLNSAAHELDKTEALRRDLIANVSHDLRTPLTLITGYAEMIRDIPGENTPENMQVIIDEAKRLSSLVGDLLDLSRLQSGTWEMRPETFDLAAATMEIIGRFVKFGGQMGYRVDYVGGEGPVPVTADHTRIGQVIYNLLINAMIHGGDDKYIRVRLEAAEGRARLAVEDNGEGIAPDKLPYVWDRYYKVDAAHKRAPAGTGLGLSIVKEILEQLPGIEYGVHSQQGQGSSFWFSLPEARD